MTKSGKECIRWDETEKWKPEDNPDAGLEDNNYCRNPNPDNDYLAWCYIEDDWEYCDVPYCFLPPSSCSSSLDANITDMNITELQAACAYHQCVADSDYSDSELNDSSALARAEVKDDCACEFERWDCKFGNRELCCQ